ncbi:hypothetical protein B296_00034333 [Ensete ventricosum]|uniref:Uncharacterized protein n=1 Tax=Ensete ventricosum TaxID=4639 RepID=A0A426Z9K1_ENSVE|nr:hypothetical protein B296_00034333 [Ensete ventricosum]
MTALLPSNPFIGLLPPAVSNSLVVILGVCLLVTSEREQAGIPSRPSMEKVMENVVGHLRGEVGGRRRPRPAFVVIVLRAIR